MIYLLERMCSEPLQASYGEPVAYFDDEAIAQQVCNTLNNIMEIARLSDPMWPANDQLNQKFTFLELALAIDEWKYQALKAVDTNLSRDQYGMECYKIRAVKHARHTVAMITQGKTP